MQLDHGGGDGVGVEEIHLVQILRLCLILDVLNSSVDGVSALKKEVGNPRPMAPLAPMTQLTFDMG